ncbi:macrolide transport system ATP-binding/permease protein [Leucobacter komagatae]|uniref:Macrolide transport system ATP-binding/permease protein n=1 Tax=Leucobacter komagatae TaxID=55969 RepID=A0A542Y2T5_9MICO|nr:ABC-F family ATP-binding cassette domain-containing protein [Leucobacter komagatae]TQL42389.1 macrolide transport system ATP-binding/permease protein [Leucobacter komagatae]
MTASTAETHLRLDGVSHAFGARRVLTDVSFSVASGARVGLIGENGSGKSTLLRIAAGALSPSAGAVTVMTPGGRAPRVGLLHQEPPFAGAATIRDALAAATAPVRAATLRLDRASEALALPGDARETRAREGAYSEALDDVERLGAWELETRVEQTLAGLGISEIPRDRATAELSGGQRARLSLAWTLLNSPDVLLLDEPTNHLDDRATAYVVFTLSRWRGPVMFASHDRAFLDEAATSLVDLDPAPRQHSVAAALAQDGTGSGIGVTRFTGGYSEYLAARSLARKRWEAQYAAEQAELRRLRASVGSNQIVGHEEWKPRTESRIATKFYADRNARVVARRVNDARSRLDELAVRQVAQPPRELTFAGFGAPSAPNAAEPIPAAPIPEPVVAAVGISVAGRLAPTTLTLRVGEKLLITGANGAGKSTLLAVLARLRSPDTGAVHLAPGTRVGILEQDSTFAGPHGSGGDRSVAEVYAEAVGLKIAEAVPLSALRLLAARDEAVPVETLSVGQRRRLALATLIADPPDVLLLDEPTNHLSLSLADAIERAVTNFPGTVVLASHDRWLRERWRGRRLELGPAQTSENT